MIKTLIIIVALQSQPVGYNGDDYQRPDIRKKSECGNRSSIGNGCIQSKDMTDGPRSKNHHLALL
jgi:hypothetical protein